MRFVSHSRLDPGFKQKPIIQITSGRMYGALLCYFFIVMFSPPQIRAATQEVFLGPANPQAKNGTEHWYHGTEGAALIPMDGTYSGAATNYFSLENTAPGSVNRADWRCETFSLESASSGALPISFSFNYELLGNVMPGDNIRIYLRFFDETGSNFLDQTEVLIGAATKDTHMTGYKSLKRDLYAPARAEKVDIWVTANVFGKWISGTARFNDFSVKAVPLLLSQTLMINMMRTVLAFLLLVALIQLARGRWNPILKPCSKKRNCLQHRNK